MYIPKNKINKEIPSEEILDPVLETLQLYPTRQKKPFPTEQDYKKGFFIRYFCYDLRTKKFNETNQANYNYFINNPNELKKTTYFFSTLKWYISNASEKTIIFNNEKTVKTVDNIQLTNYINNNYNEYYKNIV